ncbi:AAA family ATPase [Streptomyces bathyalis]|uniref:AAA family ATPase n=1 Tax=Streptomyces bathyalis TaxID=2710756 RepID=A0A7T1T3T2_9ACTN|nr:BTAD domain-containing putative transcriptional regulator [Streptomyces bathyalis]QPP05839.1 AAA family ATPase [Streptomyces bathyalis]
MPTALPISGDLPEFRVLGPLDIRARGRQLQITAPRLQAVLGALLLRADEVVPAQHLMDSVWEDNLPADPANQIAVCVSMLRRKLERAGAGRDLLLTHPPGYRFVADGVRLDTFTVRQLRDEAREHLAAGDSEAALSRLKSALSLWRGPVLSGVTRRAWQPEVRRWEEEQVAVRESVSDLQLELGLHEELIAELSVFVQQQPLLERPRGQLMLALARSGRQADALQLYRDTSSLLREELAVTPGEELRRLHEQILRGTAPVPQPEADPESAVAEPAPAVPLLASVVAPGPQQNGPCQLPGDLAEFVGREEELAALRKSLVPGTGSVPVAAIVGPGGTGKTALAVHAAHQLRPVFSDGQLYVNLRGMDEHPVTPEEALARFLRELGLPGSAIPQTLDERSEQLRSLLADRRMLIVLDNARDVRQVRPLLPGTGSCGVLLTSRARITTAPTTCVLELEVFEQHQALALLDRLVGRKRLSAEPHVAAELTEYCGRLPLAVRIVGTKLASKPHWTLEKAASRLANERRRLDELAHESLEMRTSLELSHQGLSSAARKLFRRLALLTTPDFSEWICAPLLDMPLAEGEDLLEELLDARLVDVTSPAGAGQPRYRMHDLVRLYALERVHETEPKAERTAVLTRAAATALALADLAHRTVCGGDFTVLHSLARQPPAPADVLERMASDPLRWYESDRATITALCQQAAAEGQDEIAWDLAATSRCLFSVRFHFDDWQVTHESALSAVRRQGNNRGAAAMLLGLGDLYLTRRHYERAVPLLEESRRLFREVDDRYGHALALRKAACADRITGRFDRALARWRESLPVLRSVEDLEAQAQVLRWSGQTLIEMERYEEAEVFLRDAEKVVQGFRGRSAAQVRFSLADLHLARGDLERAAEAYELSLEASTPIGDPSGRAYALAGLATVDVRRGRLHEADERLRQALEIARAIQDPLMEAQVLLGLGRSRRAAHDLSGAASLFREGAELCRRMGAPARLEQIRRAMAELPQAVT